MSQTLRRRADPKRKMDWFCVLSVDLEPPCREQVECALKNTAASFVAYEEEKAIGMVRLIGDGGMSFYIKDFAVWPGHQGKGVGQMLLMELQQYLLEHKPADWAVSLELISTKEAVEFYKKHGFEERPCEWDVAQGPGNLGLRGPKRSVEPGMFKMVRNGDNLKIE